MRREIARLLLCPECGGSLYIEEGTLGTEIVEGELRCSNCDVVYPIKGRIPIVLPSKVREALSLSADQQRRQPAGKEDTITNQILVWNRLAFDYFDSIVDPLKAVKSAQINERFEDLFITDVLAEKAARGEVVFVEIGSGPGRYFLLLGSRISTSPEAAKLLREDAVLGRYYEFNEQLHRNLSLIIGIDFAQAMIRSAMSLLAAYGLQDLIYTRIIPLVAAAQFLSLNLKEYIHAHKVVACLFQTLGNQPLRDLQIATLRTMKRIAAPNGTVIVSVFNSQVFKKLGRNGLYKDVKRVIGTISEVGERSLMSEKGFYTHWFTVNELSSLFREVQLTPEIKTGDSLPIFSKDFGYVSNEEQEKARQMIIVATAEVRDT